MGITKILVIFAKSPYTSASVVEGIRLATGVTAADITSLALFIDDGVLALVKGQEPSHCGLEAVEQSLAFLSSNDVPIRVVSESLDERGITGADLLDLPNLEIITLDHVGDLLPQFDASFTI
ncbi:MAG TPA: DsrE family protein [Candidatus Lokiarchaeia archaeon]|nr:DsrE family protein [Candidatus Lokiarchaeia archaeon]